MTSIVAPPSQFEAIAPGLEVARGAFTELAFDIHDELATAEGLPWDLYSSSPILGLLGEDGTPLQLLEIAGSKVPSLGRLLTNPLFAHSERAIVNKQPAHTAQKLHQDADTLKEITIVHFSPGGMFDYRLIPDLTGLDFAARLQADEHAHKSQLQQLPVEAGDVVRITDIKLSHRGRNPGNALRFNLVAATIERES